MRSVKQTSAFKKDLRREASGKYRLVLKEELMPIINLLASDTPLPGNYNDHALIGNWQGHFECHIRQDLLLVYRKPADNTLRLVRLGSHAEVLKI